MVEQATGCRRSSAVAGLLSLRSLCHHRYRRHRSLSFPRAHVRTNGCPCICKSSAVFSSPSANHLSMSRRERCIHGNTPASWGCECERVQASTSERRGQPSVSCDFHPRRRNATPGLLPPLLPLLLATTLSAAAVAILRRHPLGHPPPPTTRDRLSSRYLSQARARALITFLTPEDATLILGGASGRAIASCFRHSIIFQGINVRVVSDNKNLSGHLRF